MFSSVNSVSEHCALGGECLFPKMKSPRMLARRFLHAFAHWRGFRSLALAATLTSAANAALPVQTTFTGAHAEHSWTVEELALPYDWTGFEFLVLEFKASSSQRFDLGFDTPKGRLAKRIGPFAGVWVRAAIPLRFYREPAGNGIDLAATYNQPRNSYWINIGGRGGVGPTTDVRSITVSMDFPVGDPTFELRAISLAKTDPGDAVLEGKPLVDEFGQYTHADWPGKAHSLDELKRAWAKEDAALKDAKSDRCEYGGFLGTSAKATGFFRVEQIDGRWWFVCPDGHLFFSTGLNGVSPFSGTRVQGREDLFAALPPSNLLPTPPGGNRGGGGFGGSFYTWNIVRRLGSGVAAVPDRAQSSASPTAAGADATAPDWRGKWAELTTRRLTTWGFNSIHYWGPRNADASTEPRVPYAQMLRGWQTNGSIMGMPDVYAADFEQRVEASAASQLDPRKDDPYMLGYFIGNEPPWPGREAQLVDAILKGPASEMQKRLQAHLAEGDTPERRRAFVYAAFEHYLEVINAACRRHAPHHLNLGIRFGGGTHDELVKAMRGCDVFSYNTYRYAPPRATLDHLYELVQRPILIGEFHIGSPERGLASGLVQAKNQEERGVAYSYFVEQAASHPALIGTHWFQWIDQPVTGRSDGENYNIGFVDVTDQPYAELLTAAKGTHARLLDVHRGTTPPVDRRAKASDADAGAGGAEPEDQATPAAPTADVKAKPARISVHDPVMIRQDGTYYLFATGMGISVWSSKDMKTWKREKSVFSSPPAWAVEAVPTFRGHIWAPDISFFDGKYYLYYSVSAFGKNTSCIGVATNVTLDPADPRFKWEDHGKVIQSIPGQTNWNAIDPNLITDDDGTPYLVFGSFWDGLKLAKLKRDRLSLDDNPDALPTIASRKPDPHAANPPAPEGNPVDAGGNAIEAPFVFKHGGYYYLFPSIDYCCRGPKSTYKLIVGRAKTVAGPYVDKDGRSLASGGGTLLLAGDANWYGLGHCGVYDFDGTSYIVFHAYDAADQGRPKLRIDKLSWSEDGWPSVQVPPDDDH